MQISYFTNGGYVVYKAYVDGKRFSAWFDDFGQIQDAEKFDSIGRSIKPTDYDLRCLQISYGNRHNFEDWNKQHCVHA